MEEYIRNILKINYHKEDEALGRITENYSHVIGDKFYPGKPEVLAVYEFRALQAKTAIEYFDSLVEKSKK